jgi:D-alanyl-D-alanine carboxypeptidase
MLTALIRIATILAVAASSPPAAMAGNSAFEAEVRPHVEQLLADGAPGVIVLKRDGSGVSRFAAGIGELEAATPIDARDRVRAGSLVKTFVAVVVAQLAAEGQLALDDDIARFLPGLIRTAEPITVRQLLNHTSGLFDYWSDEGFFADLLADPARAWTPTGLVEYASRHEPANAPGAAWHYSNTNYIALGMIIEAVTGQPLEVALARRIFGPLDLRQTSFDTDAEIEGAHAHGYAILGEPAPVDVTFVSPSAAWAAGGGLVSTADDLATFYKALMTGELVTPALLAEMLTTVPAREGMAYGLGIAEVTLPCGTAWGHQGEFPGYLNFALTSRDGARQAVVLVNFYSLSDAGRADFLELVALSFCS